MLEFSKVTMHAQGKAQAHVTFYLHLIPDTETKSQHTLGKGENMISRVTILSDYSVQFSTTNYKA